eukprot:5265-Heterococcus_DN1.PRE.7
MPADLLVLALFTTVATLGITVWASMRGRHKYDNFKSVDSRTAATIRKEQWHQGLMYDIHKTEPHYNESNFAPAIHKAYKANVIDENTYQHALRVNKKGNKANHEFGPGFVAECNNDRKQETIRRHRRIT